MRTVWQRASGAKRHCEAAKQSTAAACVLGGLRRSFAAIAALAFAGVMVGPATALAQQARPASTRVTFTRDVAPIFQARCQACHRPGTVAPMSLLTYQDARPWARAIKERVVRREMPPWHYDKTVGIQKLKGDISLTDEQIATIAAWVDAGAPMGDPMECEHQDPSGGGAALRTSTGIAYYRKSTNAPSFTNGSEHWALTANGLLYWTENVPDPPASAHPFTAAIVGL